MTRVVLAMGEGDEREHAVARDGMAAGRRDAGVGVAPHIIQLALDGIQRHRAHAAHAGHARRIRLWRLLRVLRLAHNRLQVRPSRSIKASASFGPQVPGSYWGIAEEGSFAQARSMLSTSVQEYSVSSMRVKRVESPSIHSSRSRS